MLYTMVHCSGTLYATLYLNDEEIDSMQHTNTNSNTTIVLNQSNQLEVNVKEGDVLKIKFKTTHTNESVAASFLMGNYIK